MLSRDSIKTELLGLRGECAAFVPAVRMDVLSIEMDCSEEELTTVVCAVTVVRADFCVN